MSQTKNQLPLKAISATDLDAFCPQQTACEPSEGKPAVEGRDAARGAVPGYQRTSGSSSQMSQLLCSSARTNRAVSS